MTTFADQLRQLTETSTKEFSDKQEASLKAKSDALHIKEQKFTECLEIAKKFVTEHIFGLERIKLELVEAAKHQKSSTVICSYHIDKFGECTQITSNSKSGYWECSKLKDVDPEWKIDVPVVFNQLDMDEIMSELSTKIGVKIYRETVPVTSKSDDYCIIADWSQ
jgi:hypothetical protein